MNPNGFPEKLMEIYAESNEQHPTINIINLLEKGEIEPFILAILNDYISMDFLTKEGYSILHIASAFNKKEIIALLIEYFKIPIDILSQTKQTALMIAANFGFFENLKYLLDHEAKISLTDELNFNALLYAIKEKNTTSAIFLLSRGADIFIKDNKGCGVVHWAAYKNHVFLLRLFKRFNLALNEMDFHGFRPIDRAIANHSFETVKFLFENIKEPINTATLDILDIKNEKIKNFLMEKNQAGNRRKTQIFLFFKMYRRFLVFSAYFIWIMSILYYIFYIPNFEKNYYLIIFCFGFCFYLLCYIFFFLRKNKKIGEYGKNEKYEIGNEEDKFFKFLQDIKLENMNSCSYFHLDNLINQESLFHSLNYTILHHICFMIDNKLFLDVLDIDYKRICPTCLIYKPPKTKHCSICDCCVPFYNHHSFIFDRCFHGGNHILYVGLLFLQQNILNFYVFMSISAYYEKCDSYSILLIPEIIHLIHKTQGLLCALNLTLNLFFWGYNTIFFLIELFGIMSNLTFNEIMNRSRYRYLFTRKKTKRGKFIYIYTNATSKGIFHNLRNYLKRTLNS